MKMNHHIWAILFLCFLGAACTRVETYDLTEDELGFAVYDKEDAFKLKSKTTGETVYFNNISISTLYKEIHRSRWRKDKLQQVYLSYRNSTDGSCGGAMFVAKVGDEEGPPYDVKFSFHLTFGCVEQRGIKIKAWGHDAYQYPVSSTIDSKLYRGLYYFENDTSELYFSKDKGYVKVENTVTGDVFTIVE